VLEQKRAELPQAEVLIHPECGCVTSTLYYLRRGEEADPQTHVVSTEQMMRRVRESPAREFIVATETGVLHRMRKEQPDKVFHAAADSAECRYMKMITLEGLRDSLRDLKHEVTVPEETARLARRAIDRMLAIG
jgi:quinolinate synthase